MPIRTQIVTDGIVSEPRTTITAPRTRQELREDKKALRAYADEQNRLLTFDGRVADLERVCLRGRIAPPAVPALGSRAWYAAEILLSIRIVREALASGDAQYAASESVVVGALAAEAEARHNWPSVKGWLAYLSKQSARAKAGAETNRDNAARRTEQFRAEVDACRRRHPDWSRNDIAKDLLRQHGRADADQLTIHALAKRIGRLGPNR